MFKIDFMVEDKHLASVLREVAGKALDLHCVPVTNAVVDKANGHVRPQHDGVNVPTKLYNALRDSGVKSFSPNMAKAMLETLGYSRKTYGSLQHFGINHKLWKRGAKNKEGRGYMYDLVLPK